MVRKKLGVLFYESHAMLMFLETFSFSKKKFAKIRANGKKKTSNKQLLTAGKYVLICISVCLDSAEKNFYHVLQ